jgi:CHAD domain-containing protein
MNHQLQVAEPGSLPALAHSVALALFDGARVAHGLPKRARHLLELADTFYAAARRSGDERPDRVGRDMALALPLDGLDADEQAIVACAVALQREKVRARREPCFLRLGKKEQRRALRLAAILQVATALEAPSASRLQVRADADGTTLIVAGAITPALVAAVDRGAELWREKIGLLDVRAADSEEQAGASMRLFEPSANGASAAAPLERWSRAAGGEPVAEVARRTLRRFFDRLLAREEDVIKGEDAEDVHQMRVATRRLRASLQVVEGVYDPKLIRRFRRGLQQIAGSLGAVRDGDVFLAHVVAYGDALQEDKRADLDPLVKGITADRAQARVDLLDDLDSKRYDTFKREFAAFLTTPGAGTLPAPEPGITQRVRDFAGSAIWRRYELWRAYEVGLHEGSVETLHQARIAGKRLRYTLEFFAEPLGPQVEQVLAPLVALQENLGALQDGVTARAHVAELGLAGDQAAQDYLVARDAERATYLAELPRLWEKVASATYRRKLFELIVKV